MHNLMIQQIESIIEDEKNIIANLANISALINMNFENINWVGFYFYENSQLILGPFQGNVACTRLYPGKGVCMKAMETRTVQNIADVHTFKGHVVCDSASMSELVIPLVINDEPYGVLDIDSPVKNRFSEKDQKAFEEIGHIIERMISESTKKGKSE
ncbi:MAG: GAF domain-containing protein [Erysipelothrix sp.]|nr:GAF domain-containing protein [Erysipelothrix sp.]